VQLMQISPVVLTALGLPVLQICTSASPGNDNLGLTGTPGSNKETTPIDVDAYNSINNGLDEFAVANGSQSTIVNNPGDQALGANDGHNSSTCWITKYEESLHNLKHGDFWLKLVDAWAKLENCISKSTSEHP